MEQRFQDFVHGFLYVAITTYKCCKRNIQVRCRGLGNAVNRGQDGSFSNRPIIKSCGPAIARNCHLPIAAVPIRGRFLLLPIAPEVNRLYV